MRRPVRGDFTISVDTRTHYGVQYYDLRELGYHGLKPDESVYVRLNPYKAPNAIILLEKPDGEKVAFEVPPMQFDTAGFDMNAPVLGKDFKAMPKTHSERVFDEIKKEAYGVQSVEEADKLWKAGAPTRDTFNVMADVKDAPLYFKKAGTPLPLEEKKAAVPPMKRLSFALMMRREHADVWRDENTDECAQWLRARYPDVIPGNKIEAVVERMREKFGPKPARITPFPGLEERRRACAN